MILNLNGLAAALKPVRIPGDSFDVTLARRGTEAEQAVGFLEDGTMVVVEDAAHMVGEDVTVKVSSTIQTAVGRMLFARIVSAKARRGA